MINVYLDETDMNTAQQLTDDMIDYTVGISSNMYYRTLYHNLFYVLLDIKHEYNLTDCNFILPSGNVIKMRNNWINM